MLALVLMCTMWPLGLLFESYPRFLFCVLLAPGHSLSLALSSISRVWGMWSCFLKNIFCMWPYYYFLRWWNRKEFMKQNHSLGYYEHFLHQIVLMNEIHFFFRAVLLLWTKPNSNLYLLRWCNFISHTFIFCPKEMTTVSWIWLHCSMFILLLNMMIWCAAYRQLSL